MLSMVMEYLSPTLRNELGCDIPAVPAAETTLELQRLRLGHSGGRILQFTALLTQGCWPSGLKVSSHRYVYHLEGTEFPFLEGASVARDIGSHVAVMEGGSYDLNPKLSQVPVF